MSMKWWALVLIMWMISGSSSSPVNSVDIKDSTPQNKNHRREAQYDETEQLYDGPDNEYGPYEDNDEDSVVDSVPELVKVSSRDSEKEKAMKTSRAKLERSKGQQQRDKEKNHGKSANASPLKAEKLNGVSSKVFHEIKKSKEKSIESFNENGLDDPNSQFGPESFDDNDLQDYMDSTEDENRFFNDQIRNPPPYKMFSRESGESLAVTNAVESTTDGNNFGQDSNAQLEKKDAIKSGSDKLLSAKGENLALRSLESGPNPITNSDLYEKEIIVTVKSTVKDTISKIIRDVKSLVTKKPPKKRKTANMQVQIHKTKTLRNSSVSKENLKIDTTKLQEDAAHLLEHLREVIRRNNSTSNDAKRNTVVKKASENDDFAEALSVVKWFLYNGAGSPHLGIIQRSEDRVKKDLDINLNKEEKSELVKAMTIVFNDLKILLNKLNSTEPGVKRSESETTTTSSSLGRLIKSNQISKIQKPAQKHNAHRSGDSNKLQHKRSRSHSQKQNTNNNHYNSRRDQTGDYQKNVSK